MLNRLESNLFFHFGFRRNAWLWGHMLAAGYLAALCVVLGFGPRLTMLTVLMVAVLWETWELAWANRLDQRWRRNAHVASLAYPEMNLAELNGSDRIVYPADYCYIGGRLITARFRWWMDSAGDVLGMLLAALPVVIVAGCVG